MDVLTDILTSLRLTGGVVIDAETRGDWCMVSQFTNEHCAPFFPVPGKLIGYHYVRSGRLMAQLEGHPPVTVGRGGILLLPRNDPHLLFSRPGLPPIDVGDLVEITDTGMQRIVLPGDGPVTEMYCGYLGVSASHHPLLDSLPPILALDVRRNQEQWLESSMRFVAEQEPSADVVARLAELFFAEAIRTYMASLPSGEGGWLAGLRDPAVAKALAIIHSRYAEELDVEMLAREAGVSRTVLCERFAALLGEPPMRYCGHWRMRVAANMLRDAKHNSANVAYAVGFNSEAAFNRAFKREFGEPPATWRRRLEAESRAQAARPAAALPEQIVRYCKAKDGTGLAFSVVGEGRPLVKAANWLNHIEHDWESPVWRHWLQELTRERSLIRYDERATGLSDWDTPEISFEAFVDDLESVVDCVGLEKFDLLGISQGAAVAIAYAVRHPERVRKMVLCGGYAVGWAVRADPEESARREAMLTLTQVGWGADNPAYRQLFTNLYIPGATARQQKWFNDVQRVSASPQNAVTLQRVLSRIDVRDLLPQVSVPTLIFHANGDQVVPFAAGEQLARHIPGATFIPLEGDNHIFLEGEQAWQAFARVTREFLDKDAFDAPPPAAPAIVPKRQENIDYCSAADGTRLAFATSGDGFPLVKAPNWLTHLETDWPSPVYGHWIAECARAHRLVRADMRGFGMSDWDPPELTFEALVGDLGAVIDAAGVEQCDLLGISHGAAIAIAYAARNPERVRRLVLVNSFAAGWRVRADPEEVAWRESLLEMNRRQPSRRRSALGEMFITLYFPSASPRLIEWYNERLEKLGPVRHFEPMLELAARIDVRGELPKVRAPALVCHARQDGNAPVEVGRQVAEGMAASRFVEVDSANHILLADEPAWPVFTREFRAFLGV